ncbi:MAG: tRNA (adenosine(37)-N6)-threonylcarbamoyltransferase complex transferase subunit TsaD [Clostridiales bacterium]|nr:tRNA (adenosine(37)-N6)-threonylcarbamoyltransferase complex transferase subunit TsaD [Clostridiales bacterium]
MNEQLNKLKTKSSVKILAIESSCDETSVAIVENGRNVLSCVIDSQIEIHKRFGGVVPEVASRNHILAIDNVCKEALTKANLTFDDIDAIAVTYGAGLLGALLVGVNYAKGLAYALNKPLLAVSHIKGHIASNYISHKNLVPPFTCLLISGGHTAILDVKSYTQMECVGSTVDDAVGEAFDKVARVMGLSYPGGVNVDRLAKEGESNINFTHKNILAGTYNFSFSGIKTAVINYVHNKQQKGEPINIPNICASFQTFVVGELCNKTLKAMKDLNSKKLVVAGGVSANSFLKKELTNRCSELNYELYMPELKYCTDNAAMIGAVAYFEMLNGMQSADFSLSAKSTLPLGIKKG